MCNMICYTMRRWKDIGRETPMEQTTDRHFRLWESWPSAKVSPPLGGFFLAA